MEERQTNKVAMAIIVLVGVAIGVAILLFAVGVHRFFNS